MAIRDTEAFIRQQATLFDASLDVSPGAPFDVQVIQPLVRRLGQDPFTVDLTTFINDRITQAYPELATKEGDALTDLLNKPASLLWDPIVRENRRVKRSLSFRDPSTLTFDEADALGANIFTPRRTGDLARGAGRILFSQPQNISISPANFLTSKGGLHFFPTETQSIRTEEMLLNQDSDGLYYFDINATAEEEGAEYNIGPNELVSIANLPAAVRVQNVRRFGFGKTAEKVTEYVGRVKQSLSERSLVTLRGAAAKILENFPDVNRLNVIGFGDPEMQRDLIKGGGLGPIVASGTAGVAIADGENKALTRRFYSATSDFTAAIGGEISSWTLTVFGATGATVIVRDFTVSSLISPTELDLVDQELILGSSALSWTLRKSELTLSDIPGGILYPDTASGTVAVPEGEVHVGGSYDVHVRGTDLEEATLAIDNVTDDEPLFKGSQLNVTVSGIELGDYVLDTDYAENDEVFKSFENAELFTYSLQILEGVDAGSYRILSATQLSGSPVTLTVEPALTNIPSGPFRWRLFDQINIDLVEPKETRIEGSDLRTVQGSDTVDTLGGTDFDAFGAAEGDVLRILGGPDEGDFSLVADPIAPGFGKLQLDSTLTQSGSNLDYIVFRPNDGLGVSRPLVRLTQIELLDASNQPIGSTIPYARPVDIQTRAFQNPARGIKHDMRDTVLGLVSDVSSNWTPVDSLTLDLLIEGVVRIVTFPGATGVSPLLVVAAINTAILAATGIPSIAVAVGSDRVGIRPVRGGVVAVGGSALSVLFGLNVAGLPTSFSTFDVRSKDIEDEGGFAEVTPVIDVLTRLDVIQVLDGVNVNIYEAPYTLSRNLVGTYPTLTGLSDALEVPSQETLLSGFSPEVLRRVQIGARSLGSARVYFLEPTSFEVDPDSRFSLTTDVGTLRFLPDPTLGYIRVPAQPGGDTPQDGASAAAGTSLTSVSQDFVKSGIQAGDVLDISTLPIAGSIALTNPVPGCVNKTLNFTLDDGLSRVLTFIRDDASLATTEVSRAGVITQINVAAGETICTLTASNTIEFDTTRKLVVRSTGTANGPSAGFAGILGDVADTGAVESFTASDQNNESPHAGTYTVAAGGVSTTALTLTPAFPSSAPYSDPLSRQAYVVTRSGLQRIVATTMQDNEAEAGLYYFDVELISEGSGDEYNIDSSQQMTAEGYRSDGYYLKTDDANLTFSPLEPVKLVLSRSILEQGVDDDPSNATQISGQNLQITYERVSIVEDIQNYLSSDVERVICASPLGRHLIPVFVRFDLNYTGGSRESVVAPEVEQYIRDLYPIDPLESSDIQKIVMDRGATYIENPLDLLGIIHSTDRTVYAERSQDLVTAGRLSAFIPDVLNIVRSTT